MAYLIACKIKYRTGYKENHNLYNSSWEGSVRLQGKGCYGSFQLALLKRIDLYDCIVPVNFGP